jgi:hypothetical protein
LSLIREMPEWNLDSVAGNPFFPMGVWLSYSMIDRDYLVDLIEKGSDGSAARDWVEGSGSLTVRTLAFADQRP